MYEIKKASYRTQTIRRFEVSKKILLYTKLTIQS